MTSLQRREVCQSIRSRCTSATTDILSGQWAAFGSPSKSAFPGLRDPASQPHLFSQPDMRTSPNKQSTMNPFSSKLNPLFSTPRKLDIDFASSGGETPKSPEQNNTFDSDATPDTGMNYRSTTARFDQATMPSFTAGRDKDVATDMAPPPTPSPTKKDKRRDSWFQRAVGMVSSPGRSGEGSRSIYSDKAAKRVKAKRARDAQKQLARVRKDSVSESETNDEVQVRKTSRSHRRRKGDDDDMGTAEELPDLKGWKGTAKFLYDHPTLPHILSWYLQLALNVFLFTGVMYILWSFWSTIRSDVDKKSAEAVAELVAEMAVCAKQYTDNRCAPDTRVPAMQMVCDNWEKCMNRDITRVGRAKVSAHTFAEIFNSFLEPISYKAMVSCPTSRTVVSFMLTRLFRSSLSFWSLAVLHCLISLST